MEKNVGVEDVDLEETAERRSSVVASDITILSLSTSDGTGQPLELRERNSDIIRTKFIGTREVRGREDWQAGDY